jgi:hypothetical protein
MLFTYVIRFINKLLLILSRLAIGFSFRFGSAWVIFNQLPHVSANQKLGRLVKIIVAIYEYLLGCFNGLK